MALVIPGRNREFITAFDESLKRLNEINAAIGKNTDNKRKFTGFVLTKLQELHEKIKAIVGKIKDIKQKIVVLQGQVNQNNSGVQAKDAELINLKQQLDQLTTERTNLTTQLDQLKNDAKANETRLQDTINGKEAELRDLANRNVELETAKKAVETELNALRADMATRGDAQTQAHAEQIRQLTEQHKGEIDRLQGQIAANENQIAANEARIKELTDQHGTKDTQTQDLVNRNTELENRNRDLEAQLNTAQTELQTLQQKYNTLEVDSKTRIEQALQDYKALQAQIEENNKKITELETVIIAKDQEILRLNNSGNNVETLIKDKDGEIANLKIQIVQITKERDDLQAFNADLEKKIRDATAAITAIADNLTELTNQQFYDDSMENVTNQITEIEKTLGIINGEIESSLNQPVAGPVPGGPQPGGPPQVPPKLNLRQVSIHGYNLPNLKDALKIRSSKESDIRGNKYNQSSLAIENFLASLDKTTATNNSVKTAIENILTKKGIQFGSNGAIMGGYNKTNRKHKRHGKFTRKQKGGFLYGKFKTDSNKSNKSNKSKNTPKTNTSSINSRSSTNTTSKKDKKHKSRDFTKRKRI
jgi:DNA repair exonuclease SbcCD ATPase subunit